MNYNGRIFNTILAGVKTGKEQIAILIDPDKTEDKKLTSLVKQIHQSKVDYIFVGGSFISSNIDNCIEIIKSETDKPVVLFPGSYTHVSTKADAILLLSLISGRNPEYLIGNHILAASQLYNSGLKIISRAYILIDGGVKTSVEYISNTKPIPRDKSDIVISTAIAGEMIGNKIIYLEAGSGARQAVPDKIISDVRKHCSVPIITGGGIKSPEIVKDKFVAGTNIVVLGSAVEENPDIISHFS